MPEIKKGTENSTTSVSIIHIYSVTAFAIAYTLLIPYFKKDSSELEKVQKGKAKINKRLGHFTLEESERDKGFLGFPPRD